uniref:Biotin carboxyl carrier protein of acetyl-CoA carboxylase n=1 Tax=Kuetzingia canaliculata TaxID=228262 RepID=A0A1Z1MP84_KUECA|nr:acetyl-CoA carboxylase biotin carboxyl carrier protein [Kuetzingia canaliculata]ARW67903.1 acetyl-CoA carboxylase biotin carboxyl carrier protein [Kuetzingia canaliculata]
MLTIKDLLKIILSINNSDIQKINIKKATTRILINRTKNEQEINIINNNNAINYINSEYKNEYTQYITDTNNENKTLTLKTKTETDLLEPCISYSTIISPMVGTFYRSPAPNESPFIELNENVHPKQIVCIIEAMKLMNEIEAEVQGEVVQILVKDGDVVDCGQALMKVKAT